MRVESPSSIKRGKSLAHGHYPREGSIDAQVLELLRSNLGRPVCMTPLSTKESHTRVSAARIRLVDMYGMDIRTTHKGTANGYGGDLWWILAGEWFGSHYHDYVNRAIDAELAKNATPTKSANPRRQ